MKAFKLFSLFAFVLFLAYCGKKNIDCDNAKVVIKNIGTDTIRYCWGCNMYDSILPPGKMATTYVGQIHIGNGIEQTSTASFCTGSGTLLIPVDECVEYREVK